MLTRKINVEILTMKFLEAAQSHFYVSTVYDMSIV